jgi:hypothetical protein
MIEYTYEDVLQSLKEIVYDKGENYIYPNAMRNCVYFEANGQPSCIVGHFLYRHDILLPGDERLYEGNSATGLCEYLKMEGVAAFDERSRVLLQEAQECQDWGYTWGNSLNTAIEAVTRKYGA